MTKQVTPSGSSATMLAVRFSSLIEKKTRFSEPGEEWNCRRCLSPLEGFFAEEVALVEVPDELLLLRAVILLRDLDLERGSRLRNLRARASKFQIYNYCDVYQSKLMTGPKLKLKPVVRENKWNGSGMRNT